MASEEAEIKELSKKLAQNPDSMVFVQLADAYRRAKDLERSVEVCQQGLERHPTYTTARAILGRNFMDLGRLEEAEAEFRKIEVADPENIMAHRMLGQIFMQKGQYAEAINRQQRVLSLDPEDGTAQDLLQEALAKSKETQTGKTPPAAGSGQASAPPTAAPAKGTPSSDQSGTIKVAEIYIKKGAFDEAAEVLQEVLASDPDNALARQKLQEVNERRGGGKGSKAEDDAKAKADAEAAEKKKAEEKAKADAEAAEKKKAEEKAKADAEAAEKKKAEEKAKADADAAEKKKAEEKAKADAEAAEKKKAEEKAKADAEAAEKKKAEEKAKADAEAAEKKKAEEKAKADAEAAEKKKAEEKAKAEAEAAEKKKADEEAKRREQEEKDRKASKLSSDDILSVMTSASDDLIDEPAQSAPASTAPAKAAAPAAAAGTKGLSPEARTAIDDFLRAQAMEASMLLDAKGTVLESKVSGDAAVLGSAAGAIFSNTEKAAQRMAFGGLKQIMIVGEDGRQILFVALKAGVLVALTGRNTNLGLLRVAVNDLVKRA